MSTARLHPAILVVYLLVNGGAMEFSRTGRAEKFTPEITCIKTCITTRNSL